MTKKFTLLLDQHMDRQLDLKASARGFSNRSDYLRTLIEGDTLEDKQAERDITSIDIRLQQLESYVGQAFQEVQRFFQDVSALENVNMKALTVLLSFFDLEGISRQGLNRALQFMNHKMKEAKQQDE
jgi:Arc/MetJ-type ribon-helix-helix transcriptional regulator